MNLFRKMFKNPDDITKKEVEKVPWNNLNRVQQLDILQEESMKYPVVIYKHSTRCGVSSIVLRQFESSFDIKKESVKLYYLDVLAHRTISNEIAAKFNVHHESPQLIVLKNGEVVHDSSHQEISAEKLKEIVEI